MEKIIVFVSPNDRLDWWLIDWPIESKVKIEFVDEKKFHKYVLIKRNRQKLVTDYRLFQVVKMNEFLKFKNHKA